MPMTPPPAGWTRNTPEDRRRFKEWLDRENATATFKIVAIVVGMVGLAAMLAMYAYGVWYGSTR